MSMLDVPGATLTYDVRRNDSTSEPILLKIASPMGAAGFDNLSKHFADRTVVTYDPRGPRRVCGPTVRRSPRRRACRRSASDHLGARCGTG
jgi:hypothetical protein